MNKPVFVEVEQYTFNLPSLLAFERTEPKQSFSFIDLFAGIGGFHLAMSSVGGHCVFASEKDSHARTTYAANFDMTNVEFNDDIRKSNPETLPTHDVLCAGFPCQPFSQAGHKKGFKDGENSERGNLFFYILDIIEAKRPKAFILENVRHLVNHDEGKTFATILQLLDEANYEVSYKVIKASDFNVPQHRARVFIVGFDRLQVDNRKKFHFPIPLTLTRSMSDIFGAPCEKQIGFTLRVGGKGSNIDDRRNWEFYRVAGEVRRIGLTEAKELMTFPDSFQFPVSKSQAMKQLGNSVCVDVVKAVGQSVLAYLEKNVKAINKESAVSVPIKRNKGELSEIYALLKIIVQRMIHYGDEKGAAINEYINILRIQTTSNQLVLADVNVSVVGLDGFPQRTIPLVEIATSEELTQLANHIRLGIGTFSHHQLDRATQLLSLEKTKGTSYEKADIQIDFAEQGEAYQQQGMGIKSFLGGLPTLLNASQATNFIYEVNGISSSLMDSVNSIDSSSKIRDRVSTILKAGGCFEFVKCEKEVYESNLRKVDTQMPKMIAELLFLFFSGQKNNLLSDIPKHLVSVDITRDELACRLADFVKYSMLGIFPNKPWSGDISANGVFLVKNDAEIVVYHTSKEKALKQFFYQHCVFDTPSSGRHQFGMLYTENNRLFFKLNLQLRLKL